MERCADPALQLPIDEAILDYLLYTAIKAQLEHLQSVISGSLGSDQTAVKLSLELVECEIFRGSNESVLGFFLGLFSCAASFFKNFPLLAPRLPK